MISFRFLCFTLIFNFYFFELENENVKTQNEMTTEL